MTGEIAVQRRSRGFTLIELMIVVAIIAILSAVAIPQYRDYIKRTKISEALVLADAAKLAVSEVLQARGSYPTSNVDAGYNTGRSTYVQKITIDAGGKGIVTITMRNIDANQVDGRTITLTPSAGTSSQVFQWTCGVPAGATGVPKQFVPANCRN